MAKWEHMEPYARHRLEAERPHHWRQVRIRQLSDARADAYWDNHREPSQEKMRKYREICSELAKLVESERLRRK